MINDEHLQMIYDCIKRTNKLNQWESRFITDLAQIAKKNKALTRAQIDKLDMVWERVTAL